ncbi:MAG: PilZ domain-containing protein [Vicinamibacterales bacterium]
MRIEHPRATRRTWTMPLLYRRAGQDEWIQARVINISESGAMFAPAHVEPGTTLEVMFATPVGLGSLPPGRLVCAADVVRTTPAGTVAVRFDECRFLINP